jgi:ribulose-5-phosphate 4-epimerase/fuculose-1-phosphate aldolase
VEVEGVIKFSARHEEVALPAAHRELCCRLESWREIMAMTGLVGRDPARYGGAAYGNVSARVGAPAAEPGRRRFVVTGTQTGGKARLGPEDFCVVESYDARLNRVVSHGPSQPSSESLTHGAIYDQSPRIRFVLHAHTPVVWRAAAALRLPTTAAEVAYGTPEMAREVARLYRTSNLAELRILAMGGHEDGIIVFGHTCEEAGQVLMTYLARAYEGVCRGDRCG